MRQSDDFRAAYVTAETNFNVTSWYSEKEQPEFLPIWGIRHYILDCINTLPDSEYIYDV